MEPKYYVYLPNISLVVLTNLSSTKTETQTVLQHLYVTPNTYYERMRPKQYVYRPNI
jgi:hypothetical protein